jgi:hypothetical protein
MAFGSVWGKRYEYPQYAGFLIEEGDYTPFKVQFTTTFIKGSLPDILSSELDEVYKECQIDNWAKNKKEKSIGISADVYIQAKRFISNMPSEMISPSVVPLYTGKIGLEWNIYNEVLAIIVINGDYTFTYSIISNDSNDYGKKKQSKDVQLDFLIHLAEVLNHAKKKAA